MGQLKFSSAGIEGTFLIEPSFIEDDRGKFFRIYSKNEFTQIGQSDPFVQSSLSYTYKKGTLRGLHYQYSPFSEAKVVRVLKGRIFDVAVDIRQGSPTFLQWIGVELNGEDGKALYIPKGFAHGFQALEDNCEMLYMHSNYYNKEAEGGLSFKDPTLEIQWPLEPVEVSEKDLNYKPMPSDYKGIAL